MSITRARNLRKAMPEAEKRLWALLRRKQLDGFRFRRQHPVGPYVIDFFCFGSKLAVELDGWQHGEAEARAYDARRTRWLQAQGIEVIRFWNEDVFDAPDAVVYAIYRALTGPRPPSGLRPPSPVGGRKA